MKRTDFFFTSVVDLKYHSLSEQNMNAMYAVYEACKAINKPEKYGLSVHTIIIDAIHQDYTSRFHQPSLSYDSTKKSIEAGIKVDLDQILSSNFLESVAIYQGVIFQVFDQIKNQVENFDFEKLKLDLKKAMQEEIEVAG